jgi:DMSO/TMAO reductase YedYZ molybdopterin-dependent catalytic subunit
VSEKRTTRRGFLEVWAGAAVAACLSRVARAGILDPSAKVLETIPFVGEGSFPLEKTVGDGLGKRRGLDLSSLTEDALVIAQDRFFIRTGCPDRLPQVKNWKVRGHGLVGKPAEIDLESLKREATDRGPHLLECAGNSRSAHFGFLSLARWTGVALPKVLEQLAPLPRATQVLVSGFDEHSTGDPGSVPGASWIFPLDALREAFLATEMNGSLLAPDHGWPLRLVVPGWYGCTAIKWVNEIALLDGTAPATAQMHEYAGRTHQDAAGPRDDELMTKGQRPEGPPLARDFKPATIDAAATPVRVEKLDGAGGRAAYRIVGILWGARIPESALRIRLGPQRTAVAVERVESDAALPWRLWSHTFQPPAPGRYRIELAVGDPAVRTRRLDAGFYAREVEITSV